MQRVEMVRLLAQNFLIHAFRVNKFALLMQCDAFTEHAFQVGHDFTAVARSWMNQLFLACGRFLIRTVNKAERYRARQSTA
jgi:hypothetical protein